VQILRLVEQAGDEARGTRGAPVGTIRISCTAAFGVLQVSRLIFTFQDRYRDIGIDLSLTDERIDLVREGVDIALRLGPLTDSSMKLKRLGESRRILVAASAYIAARGRPRTPDDLSGHEGIRLSNIAGSDMLTLIGPHGERMAIARLLVRAVSPVGFVHQVPKAELPGDRHRLVAARVVHQQDVVDDVVRNFGVGAPQRLRGVVGRHHDHDALAVQHRSGPQRVVEVSRTAGTRRRKIRTPGPGLAMPAKPSRGA